MIEPLEPPDSIEEADEAIEIVRAWVADEHLQATLDPLVFEDPAIWGQLLAELARQVAITWAAESGSDANETLRDIVQAFLDEAGAEQETGPGE